MRPRPPAPLLARFWRPGLALLLCAWAAAAALRLWPSRASYAALDPAFTRGFQSLQASLSWPSWSACVLELASALDAWDARGVARARRVLVLYHVGPVSRADPLAPVFAENLRLFFASLRAAPGAAEGIAPPFVLANIVGGRGNALWDALQEQLAALAQGGSGAGSCAVEHAAAESDLLTHLQTLALLGPAVAARLGAVAALNQGVRGPLPTGARSGLDWLSAYAALLHSQPELALVGPLLSCQMAPHVQTHMFVLKADKLGTVLEHGLQRPGGAPPTGQGGRRLAGDWLAGTIVHLEVGLTDSLLDEGLGVASMHDHLALGRSAFAPTHCPHPHFGQQNPSKSCQLDVHKLGFVKFGGELMRQELLCPEVVAQVQALGRAGGGAPAPAPAQERARKIA